MRNFFVTCAAILILLTSSVEASDAEYLLNNAELSPTSSGADCCN